jgi:hypothetical protein
MSNNRHLQMLAKTGLPLAQSGNLNSDIWQLAGIPLGDGNFWIYQDKNARILLDNNAINIDIARFSASHDAVQIFDNPKQLYLTKQEYSPGHHGIIGFSCRMQTELLNGNPQDFRDGFGAFNVLDFRTGMVFDIVANGSKAWVIYERLLIPGVTVAEQAFTHVILIDGIKQSGNYLDCSVIYNRNADSTEYYIDGVLVYRAEQIPAKVDCLQAGFGIITLHPIDNGKSVSCKGQGAKGSWSDFAYYSN